MVLFSFLANIDIRGRSLPWLDGKRWLKRLSVKAGCEWLADEAEQKDAWLWVLRAPIGDTLHRHEGLWLILEARVGNKVFLPIMRISATRLSVYIMWMSMQWIELELWVHTNQGGGRWVAP